jgi:hypothetical protein
MFGFRRSPTTEIGESDAHTGSVAKAPQAPPPIFNAVSPMERVRLRWHSMDGGESGVPGQIQSIDGELVEIWFDRNAPSFNPRHSDDQVWIDVASGEDTLVFGGVLIGMRPPDTLVILVYGLPRRDQRRQYVREHVELPPQIAVELDEEGRTVGESQEVIVVDLSGGGVRFELDRPVSVQSRLQLTLDVGTGPFDAVVRVIDTYQSMSGRLFARCCFLEISERFRIDVIRFVFREQLRKARLTSH